MKIIELDCVDSTNEYLKRNNFKEDTCVVAKMQTGGKGTKGRSFCSETGGIYISILRHYKNFAAENAFKIMINSCVAVCKTLESISLSPVIRWSNDVLCNGKKISGTLIENTFSNGNICRSIVGIGVNINNNLPPELENIATTAKDVLKEELPIDEVKSKLIENLQKEFSVEDYKSYINWFNRRIILRTASGDVAAVAKDIECDGRLIVEIDGEVKKISSGEVSLKL